MRCHFIHWLLAFWLECHLFITSCRLYKGTADRYGLTWSFQIAERPKMNNLSSSVISILSIRLVGWLKLISGFYSGQNLLKFQMMLYNLKCKTMLNSRLTFSLARPQWRPLGLTQRPSEKGTNWTEWEGCTDLFQLHYERVISALISENVYVEWPAYLLQCFLDISLFSPCQKCLMSSKSFTKTIDLFRRLGTRTR